MSDPSAAPIVTATKLALGYDGRAILPAFEFSVRRGDVWALVGRNGSGKTTLLKTLLGFIPPVSGSLRWSPGVRSGYVSQRADFDAGIPARVCDVVAAGLDRAWNFLRPWRGSADRAAIRAALDATHATEFYSRRYTELSEGQKQRVLMARAVVSNPGVLILDEPTSAMDPFNEAAIFALLNELRTNSGITVIVASHHPRVVPLGADFAVFLDREDGVALAGTVAAVTNAEPFVGRYGHVVKNHADDHAAPPAAAQAVN